MVKINLLDSQRKEIVKRQELAQKFNRVAYGAFLVAVFLFGGAFFFNLSSSGRLTSVNRQISEGERRLEELDEVRVRAAMVLAKLHTAGEILGGREILVEKIGLFFRVFESPSVEVREVGFGDARNREELEIGATAPSVVAFNNFTAEVDQIFAEEELKGVLLSNVTRDELGLYRVNYSFNLPVAETESSARARR